MHNISFPCLNNNKTSEVSERKSVNELRLALTDKAKEIESFALDPISHSQTSDSSFKSFEQTLIIKVFAFARLAIMLFLAEAENRVTRRLPNRVEKNNRIFRRAPAQARNLNTWFGVVRYWRTYMREATGKNITGYHPLDLDPGLTADRVSMSLLAIAVRLATKMSFAESREVLGWFIPKAPSTEVIEQAVLGFGRHTGEWFEQAKAPENDGDVLIIMIDSKGAPTATEQELKLRRGKRKKRSTGTSARHRGRRNRKRYTKKPRRKRGDKSKNAKMATMVVMYTLRRRGKYLLGPINRWVYASFAPKKHAFAIALREAKKRGFCKDPDKLVQVVFDGDNDLKHYCLEYFPNAIRTIDIMHVIEKLWEVGKCFHREGSDSLRKWVEQHKEYLYKGKVQKTISELQYRLDTTSKNGPGNKWRRTCTNRTVKYLKKRIEMMNYHELIEKDLEIGSGAVEGAIKHIIGKRCDHGGMRWIKERAEALLQLRCIEVNGDWEGFIQKAHDANRRRANEYGERIRIQQAKPAELPDFMEKAA